MKLVEVGKHFTKFVEFANNFTKFVQFANNFTKFVWLGNNFWKKSVRQARTLWSLQIRRSDLSA